MKANSQGKDHIYIYAFPKIKEINYTMAYLIVQINTSNHLQILFKDHHKYIPFNLVIGIQIFSQYSQNVTNKEDQNKGWFITLKIKQGN